MLIQSFLMKYGFKVKKICTQYTQVHQHDLHDQYDQHGQHD